LGSRVVTHPYEDPLDRIWLGCAERIGLRIARTPDAFATTDGRGTLLLATDEHLDRDDCLAQMIFHELCHSLVEGPASLERADWGLDNQTGADDVREHACLRLQALLLRPRGLRRALGPTTDFRAFYDALPADPLEGSDASIVLARAASVRVSARPWAPHLEEALDATAAIARTIAAYRAGDESSLWSLLDERPARHSLGFPMPADDSRAARETCKTCAWAVSHGTTVRCKQAAKSARPEERACERWEPALDCRTCGACCREAFHSVDVAPRDALRKKRPDLLTLVDGRAELARPNGRCVALEGGGSDAPFTCVVYDDRPKSCREFARESDNCLLARRRVGLSR
jgi:hypothetical protein